MEIDTEIVETLAENAKQHQVIILTCTKREQELLEKMQIPYFCDFTFSAKIPFILRYSFINSY